MTEDLAHALTRARDALASQARWMAKYPDRFVQDQAPDLAANAEACDDALRDAALPGYPPRHRVFQP